MKRALIRIACAAAGVLILDAASMAVERSAAPPLLQRRQQELPPPPGGGGCVPVTCEQAKAACGSISDGCGHVVDCGTVKGVVVDVAPKSFTGICPRTFTFTATITTNRKGKVRYQWANAPSVDHKGEVAFDGSGTVKVVFPWAVPANLPPASQWLSLTVVDENGCNNTGAVKTPFSQKCTVLKPGGMSPLPAGIPGH